jgi:hypothetical protein
MQGSRSNCVMDTKNYEALPVTATNMYQGTISSTVNKNTLSHETGLRIPHKSDSFLNFVQNIRYICMVVPFNNNTALLYYLQAVLRIRDILG